MGIDSEFSGSVRFDNISVNALSKVSTVQNSLFSSSLVSPVKGFNFFGASAP
jgi:hypothetical protein